jgi:hypothetical protein
MTSPLCVYLMLSTQRVIETDMNWIEDWKLPLQRRIKHSFFHLKINYWNVAFSYFGYQERNRDLPCVLNYFHISFEWRMHFDLYWWQMIWWLRMVNLILAKCSIIRRHCSNPMWRPQTTNSQCALPVLQNLLYTVPVELVARRATSPA